VIVFRGRITIGPESQTIDPLVQDLLRRGQKRIVLDLSAVEYVDSTGLGIIARCYSRVKQAQGSMRLAGVGGKLLQIFHSTRLDVVLDFYPTVEVACQGFAAG